MSSGTLLSPVPRVCSFSYYILCACLCHSSSPQICHLCTGSPLDCPDWGPDLLNGKIAGAEHLAPGWLGSTPGRGNNINEASSWQNMGTPRHLNEPGQREGRQWRGYSDTKFSPVSSPQRPEPHPCSVGTFLLASRTLRTCRRPSPAGTPPGSPSSPAARS